MAWKPTEPTAPNFSVPGKIRDPVYKFLLLNLVGFISVMDALKSVQKVFPNTNFRNVQRNQRVRWPFDLIDRELESDVATSENEVGLEAWSAYFRYFSEYYQASLGEANDQYLSLASSLADFRTMPSPSITWPATPNC